MRNNDILKTAFCLKLIFFLSGCVLMEKAGQFLDGSMFAQKITAVYDAADAGLKVSLVEYKNGERELIIAPVKYPMIKIRASMPDGDGNFFPLTLEYLAGNTHGWNEFSLDLMGSGNFTTNESFSLLTINEIEPVQITAGRIHSYDTRITGAQALVSLRNRHERITALVEWMTSHSPELAARLVALSDKGQFEKYWQPILFPETVSKSKRPQDWLWEGDIFKRAEDINWNTGYTRRVFAPELAAVRDSATLFRDWEEALSWIYYEYEWKNIAGLLSGEIIFKKKEG